MTGNLRRSHDRPASPVSAALEKRVTAILYGCDQKVWSGGDVDVRVFDVFASGGPRLLYQGRVSGPTLDLRLQLPFDAGQVYGVTLAARRHRAAWRLLWRPDFLRGEDQVERDDIILRLMIMPNSPGTSDVANGFDRLRQLASPFASPPGGIDAGIFRTFGVAAKMAFLNIEAKLRETFIEGASLLSFVRGVRHVGADRVFLLFEASLKEKMPRAIDFAAALGHGVPDDFADLPPHPDSWKHTRFAEGNVQLSFSSDVIPSPGPDPVSVYSADVDIDLGRGIAHLAECIHNALPPGHKTDQRLVYALLYAQGIVPKYALDPAPALPASRARRRES